MAYRARDALTNVRGGHYTRDEDNNGRHGKRAVPPLHPNPLSLSLSSRRMLRHFPKRLRAPTVSADAAPAKDAREARAQSSRRKLGPRERTTLRERRP